MEPVWGIVIGMAAYSIVLHVRRHRADKEAKALRVSASNEHAAAERQRELVYRRDRWINDLITDTYAAWRREDELLDELSCVKAERDKWITLAGVEQARAEGWVRAYESQRAELEELRDGPYNRLVARLAAEGKGDQHE